MKVEYESKLCEWIVRRVPRFRGSSKLLSLLVNLIPGRKTATLFVDSMKLTLDLRYSTHLVIARKNGHEPQTTRIVTRILSEGDVFFDIGANWGYFSILASQSVGRNGLVVAVEPYWRTYIRLCHWLRTVEGVNTIALNAAVSDTTGEMLRIHSPWYRQDTAAHIVDNKAARETVVSRTLDCIWRQVGSPSIRLIKIDVEGYEQFVIAGGMKAIGQNTEFVICELGAHHSRYNYRPEQVEGMMMKMGYRFAYDIDEKAGLVGKRDGFEGNRFFSRQQNPQLYGTS
jgi:FkbM family methyltransferase